MNNEDIIWAGKLALVVAGVVLLIAGLIGQIWYTVGLWFIVISVLFILLAASLFSHVLDDHRRRMKINGNRRRSKAF